MSDQLGFDRRGPAPDHLDNGGVQRLRVRKRRFLVDILSVADEREVGVTELDRPARDLAADLILKQTPDRQPPGRAQLLARQPYEREQLPLQDAADLKQGRARTIGKRHRHHHEIAKFLIIDSDDQVARQRSYGVTQRLSGMPFRIEAEILVQLLQPRAQDGHFLRRYAEGLACPQAGMDPDALYLAVLPKGNDHQIERDAAMNRRAPLGLGHQWNFAAPLQIMHCARDSRPRRSARPGC